MFNSVVSLCLYSSLPLCFFFFFFNDTATTEIYTLSLHDALPISHRGRRRERLRVLHGAHDPPVDVADEDEHGVPEFGRSEEHTSELQSQSNLVCRLLLEKKKKQTKPTTCPTSTSDTIFVLTRVHH